MTAHVQTQKKKIVDNFYYLQLIDALIPLTISFGISVLFIILLYKRQNNGTLEFDQTIVYMGFSCTILFIGFVVRAVHLLLLSEKKLSISETSIRFDGKSFAFADSSVYFKPKQHRPIKLFHLFFLDVDTIQIKIIDNKKSAFLEVKSQTFDLLSIQSLPFKQIDQSSFEYREGLLLMVSNIIILVSSLMLIFFFFFYFIVR